MIQQSRFIQQTDLYPDIAKELHQILAEEKIHARISVLPYIPEAYIHTVCNPLPGRLEFLSACKRGLIFTLYNFRKTDYHDILKIQQTPFFTRIFFILKFYKYLRYLNQGGWDIKTILIQHQQRNQTIHLGKIRSLPVEKVLPLTEFNAFDKEILALFENSVFKIFLKVRHTSYYKIQRSKRKMSVKQAFQWVLKYYSLFRSIKKQGFTVFDKSLNSYPWLFVSKHITIRLDGHHRSAIATHLKIKTIPVLLVTPEDLAANGKGSGQLFNALENPVPRQSDGGNVEKLG